MFPAARFRGLTLSKLPGIHTPSYSAAVNPRCYATGNRPPINLGVHFVPQQQAWIAERFGKFLRVMHPGLNFLIPLVDSVRTIQILQELVIQIPSQSAVTADNVTLHLDGVLYVKVHDPYQATYGVEDVETAVTQLAQTTMRSELGKITLDHVFKERENLNYNIVESISGAAHSSWGLDCLRYEIRDITLPERVKDAMQLQVEAERRKRALILESEGIRESDINKAEGRKQAAILASEANKQEQINEAEGEARALLSVAQARAMSINHIAESVAKDHGVSAASLNVAELYVSAFSNLAKEGNTILLPGNAADVANTVTQAMGIYGHLHKSAVQQSAAKPTLPSNQQSIDPASNS